MPHGAPNNLQTRRRHLRSSTVVFAPWIPTAGEADRLRDLIHLDLLLARMISAAPVGARAAPVPCPSATDLARKDELIAWVTAEVRLPHDRSAERSESAPLAGLAQNNSKPSTKHPQAGEMVGLGETLTVYA